MDWDIYVIVIVIMHISAYFCPRFLAFPGLLRFHLHF